MNTLTTTVSLDMFHDALESMGEAHELDVTELAVRRVYTPVGAAKISRVVEHALEGPDINPEISITADIYDFASRKIESDKGSRTGADTSLWAQLISRGYKRYLDELEVTHPMEAFKSELNETIKRLDLDPTSLITFEDFIKAREFHHISTLPEAYEGMADGIDITEYCVCYPGTAILGYDPADGEAWFEDYKDEFRGPIELIERKLYVWAIVEMGDLLTATQVR